MKARNHQRNSELKQFLALLNGQLSKQQKMTAFIIIIENTSMLSSAYGHLGADEIISGLCDKISEKNPHTYRISDNSIAILCDGMDNKKNIAKTKFLKKQVSSFGFKKYATDAAHISSLINFLDINNAEQSAEEILGQLCAHARKNNSIEENTDSDAKQSRTQMALANQVYRALNDNHLQLAFQPVIEAKTGILHNHECLLRIVDADGQATSAGSFIQIAEKMGIIENIDIRVLDMVLDKLEAHPEIRLSFNVSNLTIGNTDWSKRFFQRITPELARRLTVEITETAAMLDMRSTAYFIAKLQETGAQVALDDFGSGYTSFRQIRSLSLDYVKIDGFLIKDITTNHHNQLLVKSLLEFLKGLHLKTIAEFVDGGDTAKFLIEAGVDYMQGNYFGAAAANLIRHPAA